MKRHRALLAAAALGACGLALVVSCSFPDVQFAGGTDGGGSDGGGMPMAIDAAAFTSDGQVASGDGGGKVDAQGCDPLDCDGDGDKNKNFDAGPDGPAPDCDDLDVRAKHSQTDFLDDLPVEPTNGDWNCDKSVVKLYPINVACSGFLAGDTCSLVKGFTGDPGCGQAGPFVYCKKDTFLGQTCTIDRTVMDVKQACQ
jgi:hypothetical protein